MGFSVHPDFRPPGSEFRSIWSGFRPQGSEIRPPQTEIRPPIWSNSDNISMTKMQTHNTNFAYEVLFRCDSISRPDLCKVLDTICLKFINFEDFEVFTVRPTED